MITLEELFLGKETVIRGKEYFSTRKYVEPFINRMTEFTKEFRVYVKTPDQMTGNIDKPDITYNRVLVQAVLPNKIDTYNEVICFCYALDVRKPVAKFYRAYVDLDTNAMLAFNPMWQSSQQIEPEEPISYADVKKLMELSSDVQVNIDNLENDSINFASLNALLGKWVRATRTYETNTEFGKIKLSASNAIDSFESLFDDRDSSYFCETKATKFDCLESFARVLGEDKKDIINRFDKTILINTVIK